MTAMETAVYQKVPTDEAEAQMLATVDLDDMKSKSGNMGLAGYNICTALTADCFLNKGKHRCIYLLEYIPIYLCVFFLSV